ncbi:hypothetical protein DL96DRAFT_1681465, partial [Flagelloscypha sp. PMI_526]
MFEFVNAPIHHLTVLNEELTDRLPSTEFHSPLWVSMTFDFDHKRVFHLRFLEFLRSTPVFPTLTLNKSKPNAIDTAVQPSRASSASLLPIELLFEIFMVAVSASDILDHQIGEGISMLPITLGRVSRIWRQAVVLSPIIWSFFRIHTGTPDRHLVPKFELCLERSQTCLLDIIVATGEKGLGDMAHLTTYIIDRLAFYSKRWVSITLHMGSQHSYYHRGCLESLDKPLKLSHLQTLRLNNATHLPKCFQEAPALKTLDIGFSWNYSAGLFPIPPPKAFQNLEVLSVAGKTLSTWEAVSFIQCHPSLRSLELDMAVRELESNRPHPGTTISLPNLTSIVLSGSCHILRALDCPNLQIIGLSTLETTDDSPRLDGLEHDLPAFLAKTPSVRILRHRLVTPLTWLQNPLTSGSLIEHLELEFSSRKTTLVLKGIPVLLSPPVLSCLTSISLTFRPPDWFWFDFPIVEEFLQLLPRRNPPSVPRSSMFPTLEKVHVTIALQVRPEPYGKEEVAWLVQWRKIQDTAFPGAMSFVVTIPKEGMQNDVEFIDPEMWLKVEEQPKATTTKKNRGRRMNFGSIFPSPSGLAIYFHDIVYDPKAKDNEEQSILVFDSFIEDIGEDAIAGRRAENCSKYD